MLKSCLTILTGVLVSQGAQAAVISINFDTDALGAPLTIPGFYSSIPSHLTELYAPLGVHFSGPNATNGGGIVNQSGNFGVNARSGVNFLAFNVNPGVSYGDLGHPTDPETITFDTLMDTVSIYAAGGNNANTFVMAGFDTGGSLVVSQSVTTQTFAPLQISWPLGLRSVRLSVTAPPTNDYFVYDDLFASSVPEPSSALLLGALSAVGLARRPFGRLQKRRAAN